MCSLSVCIVEVRVTVNILKYWVSQKKCFYGEFISPLTIVVLLNLLMSSYCSLNAILVQNKNFPFGVNTVIELKKYNSYIKQYRQTLQSKHTQHFAIIVRCNYYVFELNCNFNSKWTIFGLCQYWMQGAILGARNFAGFWPNLKFLDTFLYKPPQYQILRKSVQWEPRWGVRTDGQTHRQRDVKQQIATVYWLPTWCTNYYLFIK